MDVSIADIAGKFAPRLLWTSRNSLRRVLHFSAAERPVFATGIHETDPDVFLSHLRSVVDFVRDVAEEPLLYVHGSATNPRDLNYDEVGRVLHAQVEGALQARALRFGSAPGKRLGSPAPGRLAGPGWPA